MIVYSIIHVLNSVLSVSGSVLLIRSKWCLLAIADACFIFVTVDVGPYSGIFEYSYLEKHLQNVPINMQEFTLLLHVRTLCNSRQRGVFSENITNAAVFRLNINRGCFNQQNMPIKEILFTDHFLPSDFSVMSSVFDLEYIVEERNLLQ